MSSPLLLYTGTLLLVFFLAGGEIAYPWMLDDIAIVASLGGLYLNGRKNAYCWPIWILSNFYWIAHWVMEFRYDYTSSPQWTSIILNVVLIILNIIGWRRWHNEAH